MFAIQFHFLDIQKRGREKSASLAYSRDKCENRTRQVKGISMMSKRRDLKSIGY